MAFSNEGFSIREYTWRMRSVDVVKCWPFDDITTYDERKMKSFLPQITVKKFRWWFDELQFSISGSNKKVKRKKGLKRNDSIIEEAEESDDDRVASKKVKAPKRRSIVELFAVAPPVETVHIEEESDTDSIEVCYSNHDEDEGAPNCKSLVSKNPNYDRKEKNIKKGHSESRILLKKQFKKDKKQLNMKENGLMEFKIAKKRPYKSIMHPPVNPTLSSSCSLFDKQLDEDGIGAGWCEKKKPQLKSSAKGKKSKVLRTSKLFFDCLKPESPPQGIVGKLDKVLTDQNSVRDVLHKASDKHQCGTQLSNKDSLIGKLRQEYSPVRCPELREPSVVNSSDISLPKDCPQGTRAEANSWVTNVTRCISRNTEGDLCFEPIIKGNLCETEHSLDKVSITRDTSNVQENYFNREQDASLTREHHLCACGAGPAVSLGDYGQQFNFQLPERASLSPNTCRIFGALSGNNFPRVNKRYLKEYATAPVKSSWSPLSTLNENTATHLQYVKEASTRNFRSNYPIPRLTPKELMHTICPTFSWKQKELEHGEIRMPDDFVGLPLNSQGELIKMNSKCISANDRRPLKGLLQVSPKKDFALQNSCIAMSSGLVHLESQLTRNITIGLDPIDGDSHSSYSFESDLEQITIPQISQKLDYQTLKHVKNLHIQNPKSSCQVQSTVRLMGKEFTVGERNLQQLEDGKVWTDKQTIVETLHGSNDIEKSHRVLGTTENSTTRLLGTGASSTSLADSESGPKKYLYSHNCEEELAEQHGFGSIRRKHGFVIQESAKREYPNLSSYSLSSTHDVLGLITSSNNARRKDKGPFATSALHFPVLHSRPTWSLGTSPSIFPSWSGDIEKRALMYCLPSFPDSLGSCYSESSSCSNLLKDPSLDKPTFNCLPSPHCFQRPLGLHASSHYHQIPTFPGSTLDIVTHNRYGNKMKSKRQANSITSARGPDLFRRTNKWPPMLLVDSTLEFPNLSPLEDNGDTVKSAQKDCLSSEVDTHCDSREDESCSFNDLDKAKESDQFHSNESIDGSCELISRETNDPARIRPVKLAAGGRHILMPCKRAGQTSNLPPTSSTIRFDETTSTQNVLQSDEKPARIYKF